ncbi:MAG: helix-turn-helix transcriptional regulator [Polyangiaceae bacterium]
MRSRDILDIVESAYDMDADDDAWLARLGDAVYATLPFPALGVVANGYDISNPAAPRFDLGFHVAADGVADFLRGWGDLRRVFEDNPDYTRASYGALDEGLGLEIPGPSRARLAQSFASVGVGDVYGINGRNASGRGVFLGVVLPRAHPAIPDPTRRAFARIGRHIAAAHRLRNRLNALEGAARRIDQADAILSPDGSVEHAQAEAQRPSSLAELRRRVVAVSRARQNTRIKDPARALESWKALVDARWSLTDHFAEDGAHYLVAHRNDPSPAPLLTLTARERQVAALAAMGLANKVIAYDLGLATSTVGVLLGRALKRLGLKSRHELRSVYERVNKKGDDPDGAPP